MSVLKRRLDPMVGEEIIVVMSDERAFRGQLKEFDDQSLVLEHVVEGTTDNARNWEEPTAGTGVVHKVVSWKGIYNHEDDDSDVVRMKDVIVQLPGVLRIWSWSRENLEEPEHMDVERKRGGNTGNRNPMRREQR